MKKGLKIFGITTLVVLLIITIVAAFFISSIMNSTKNIVFDKNKLMLSNNLVQIYDNDNNEFVNRNIGKEIVEIDSVPEHVKSAFISIEDKNFYSHKGLNYKRIAKAMLTNLKSGSFKEGASTISQQLIKNTHLNNEKTITRKVKEMALTKKLENTFSKNEILEVYLNVIYFGEGAYGIENASKTYFNKATNELSIAEGATLAGIIKSPKTYSPIYNKENCIKRRNLVLSEMLKDNKISTAEYEKSVNEELVLNLNNANENIENLYFKMSLSEAKDILKLSESDIARSGVQIYTYLNPTIQNNLHEKINNDKYYLKNTFNNVADSMAIIIDNKTGGVVAVDGKSDYDLTNFKRQPGSAIKPILVYSPALEKGIISPATKIDDSATNFGGYAPKNVGNKFYGKISARDAVAKSLNIPAIKTLQYVGIKNAKKFAENAGIEFSEKDDNLAIALGGFTDGINLKSLTNSYIPYSNNGKFIESKFIKKIISASGETIYENNVAPKQIMGSDTAYLTHDMLVAGVEHGTSAKLKNLPFEVAGKTGTVAIPNTNNNTDAISVAYTKKHTMGMWFGNYSLKPEYVLNGNNNGGTKATEIICDVFKDLYALNKPEKIEMPDSCEILNIDAVTYKETGEIKLANDNFYDRFVMKEVFSKNHRPKQTSEKFNNPKLENLSVNVKNLGVEIKFNCEQYYTYEIMKKQNAKWEKVTEISGKTGEFSYLDNNVLPNTTYEFKVVTKFKDNKTESEIKKIRTNKTSVVFEKLITKKSNNENTSWYFN